MKLAKVFGIVIAFEPAMDSMECLGVNIAEAGLRNTVLFRAACGRQEERGYVVQDDRTGRCESSGNRFVRGMEVGKYDVANRGHVRIMPITALGVCYKIDLIKIDVEGAEIEVLEGARATIGLWHPVLVVEVSSKIPADIDRFMESVGYVEATSYKADRAYIHREER